MEKPKEDRESLSQAEQENLEREFKANLEALVGEKSMSRFQGAYERLYRAMKTSLESESRLFKRCNELNQTIVSNAARVKAALRLTQEDSATIKLLKSEVEKAWKLVALSKEKDDKKSKHIDSLKEQIE